MCRARKISTIPVCAIRSDAAVNESLYGVFRVINALTCRMNILFYNFCIPKGRCGYYCDLAIRTVERVVGTRVLFLVYTRAGVMDNRGILGGKCVLRKGVVPSCSSFLQPSITNSLKSIGVPIGRLLDIRLGTSMDNLNKKLQQRCNTQ